jgi:hypothetical protein
MPALTLRPIATFASTVATVGLVLTLAPIKAEAKAQYFSCVTQAGVPTTVAMMSNGKQVPVIRWTSSVFSNDGWSPERRCQEVSSRFSQFNDNNQLRYLTTGYMNGMNVICIALNKGDRCSGLVYTLKPGQNPTQTLNRLFGVQRTATGPLNETGDRTYIDMNQYLGVGRTEDLPPMTTGDNLNAW